jgi:uncharacterized protein YbjT (DUF2867 family)
VTVAVLAITGGTGFVGAELIDVALAAGWSVRALARSPQAAKPGVTWVPGALDRPDSLYALAQGADAIIHVAGVVNAPDRAAFEAGNAAGTLAMIEATKAARVQRFVHVSSLAAREPSLSNYGWSKARAEAIVQASGLDWTIIRPPTIYGPGDRDLLDLFRFARFGIVPIPPRGRQSIIAVNDLARLLLAVVPADETYGALYEADDGVATGWGHDNFAKAIGWAVGGRVLPLHLPRPLLTLASKVDRLLRRKRAKLTADRVSYMCHPDWVIDPRLRPPSSLWMPETHTRSGMKITANAYRRAGLI